MNLMYAMEGVGVSLEVYDDKVTITPRGVQGFISRGLKGTKSIPFTSITAIQFKESGFRSGYLQFTIPGGRESTGGLFEAASDENTFIFRDENDLARMIKDYIESQMRTLHKSQNESSGGFMDQLQKLAAMKREGLLSEEEFVAAKAKLLH